MDSLDGQVTQKAQGYNAKSRKCKMMSSKLPSLLTVMVSKGGAVFVDVESMSMMSDGVIDVKSSIISQNTSGNGKCNSKSQEK